MVATHSYASSCRSQNIRESQQMSIQRNVDLHDLDQFGPRHSPANRRKAEPPLPPNKKKQDEPQVRARMVVAVGSVWYTVHRKKWRH